MNAQRILVQALRPHVLGSQEIGCLYIASKLRRGLPGVRAYGCSINAIFASRRALLRCLANPWRLPALHSSSGRDRATRSPWLETGGGALARALDHDTEHRLMAWPAARTTCPPSS